MVIAVAIAVAAIRKTMEILLLFRLVIIIVDVLVGTTVIYCVVGLMT